MQTVFLKTGVRIAASELPGGGRPEIWASWGKAAITLFLSFSRLLGLLLSRQMAIQAFAPRISASAQGLGADRRNPQCEGG